jgi:pimeloyl-ACP methyl ester carboxylesterase
MQITTVETSTLLIACEISGPEGGHPIVLMHGWPDDVRTWDAILPSVHAAGFRTFTPFLRGFGPTRFRSATTPRCGQLTALAQDLIDLADALSLERFAVVGHDWGARAAYIASAVAPSRVMASVALSVGWGTNDPDQSLSLRQVQNYWYHWLMALERGARLVQEDRDSFTRYIWSIWNPDWQVSEADLALTAKSFDNPDWAEITLHSYRVRWGLAPRHPAFEGLEARIAADPVIRVPTLVLHGGADPCNDPVTSEGRERLFAGKYLRRVLNGLGHFPQRQGPKVVAAQLVPFLTSQVG